MTAATAQAGPVLPTGGKVVAGSAVIGAPAGGALTISQSSSKAIINWNGFSVGQGGAAQFNNGSGATLNRVTGAGVSSIDGLLGATGSVYLINPNGVIIGKTGVVNVGGTFVASTLDVADASFLAGGALDFTGASSGSVINLGKIGALGGDVALMGAKVENDGTISAAGGTAALVAGHSVLLRDAALDDGRFAVLVGGADTSVTNTGLIQAANAELRAEGGNVYALAGNTAGVVRATGIKAGDGKVWLVAEGGTLDVAGAIEAQGSNGSGGRIETSGQTVNLGQARIDAHGGSWLVDPVDLTIDATAATAIDNALNAGTSVTEQTTASGSSGEGTTNASGNGDIIVAAPISWATTAALTLSAYRDIDVNASITASGGGALTLVTDNSGAGDGGTLAFAPGASVQFTGVANGQPTGSLAIGVGTAAPTAYVLVSDLTTLSNDIAANNAGDYALATSVDGSNGGAGYTTASPLASTLAAGFAGTLQGLGNSVSNLTINDPADTNVGLFAQIGAAGVVRDLNLAGGSVTGGDTVGPLAGENDGSVIAVTSSAAVIGSAASSDGTTIGGLVGYNTGTINRSSASGAVSGYQALGGLVGIDNGASSAQPGLIENSYATGQVTVVSGSGNATSGGLAGGLVGQAYGETAQGAQFVNDYATGSVTDNGVYNSDYPGQDGGLIGNLLAGSVTGSYATGAVTSAQGYAVGGLIGYAGRTGNVTISDSYATGAVSTFNDAGGLIGEVRAPENDANVSRPGILTITNSYATGSVIATSYDAGGLIGGLYQEPRTTGASSAGPAVSNSNTVISDVYATGYVYSPNVFGGLIGKNPGTVTITDGYYDNQTTGQTTDNAGGTGETTAALQAALPAGFDSATWGIVAGSSYPYLLSQFAAGVTPEVISGTAYGDGASGTTIPLIGVVRNGAALGQVGTGADGYYYMLTAPSGAVASSTGGPIDNVLTYRATGSTQGSAFVQTNRDNPDATGADIFANAVKLSTVQSSLSALTASIAPDLAAAPTGAVNFTLPSTGGVATGGANLLFFTSGDFTLDGALNLASASGSTPGNLNLAVNGALTQTAGVITANVLSGSAETTVNGVAQGAANLPDANLVNSLGNFSAATGLVFNNAQALMVTGTVAGGSGTTSLTTTSGDLTIAQGGSVSGDLTLSAAGNLTVSGNVTATDGALNLQADSAGTGTGTLTIANNVTISTANGAPINIFADMVSDNSATFTTTNSGGMTVTATPTVFQFIYTLAQLQAIDSSSTSLAGDYALNANIDASATGGANPTVTFTPIGSTRYAFTGVFDGLNHTISNLTINDTADDAVGLFANNSGTIRNIGLMNLTVTSQRLGASVGGLAGFNSGGSISNSFVTGVVSGPDSATVGGLVGDSGSSGASSPSISGSYATAAVTGGSGALVGGLVGYNDGYTSGTGGTIIKSYATGAVTVGSGGVAGGLVGVNDGDDGIVAISTSYATGAVSDGGNGATALGGLVGYNVGDGGTASINLSFATGAVTGGQGTGFGGLVGVNAGRDTLGIANDGVTSGSASITDAYATGAVTGRAGTDVGGLVGYNYGGFDGANPGSATIASTYATGAISGAAGAKLGGLVGYSSASGGTVSISGSYFDKQTTGQTSDGGNDDTTDENNSTTYSTATPETTAAFASLNPDTNAFTSGATPFPYLTGFYASAPQTLGGSVYGAGGVGLLASGVNGAQTLTALSGGALVGTATTGVDGTYYLAALPTLNADGSFGAPVATTGGVLTYLTSPSGTAPAAARLDVQVSGAASGLDLWSGALFEPTAGATLSAAPSGLGPDVGYLTAATGANTTLAAQIAALPVEGYIATTPTFTIDRSPAGSLYVASTSGDIVVAAGAPVVMADGTTLELSAPNGSLTFDTSMDVGTAGGTGGALRLYASTDATYGTLNLSFAPGASLSYLATGTAGTGDSVGAPLGSLSINGAAYTLLNELAQTGSTTNDSGTHDVAAIDAINSRSNSDSDFALVANLNGTGTTFTTALAAGEGFSGVFEGLGHTITGLTISNATSTTNTSPNLGLLANNAGTVRDIGLVGGSVTNAKSASAVGDLVGDNSGKIVNAYATGSVTSTSSGGTTSDLGGLAGESTGLVTNAYATGAVAATSGKNVAGGLVGFNSGAITHAYATGTVDPGAGAQFSADGGGLVGENSGRIDTAYATGATISSGFASVGGLVGYNENGASISHAYATGAVSAGSGKAASPSPFGGSSTPVYSDIGGLVGENGGTIAQAYATGYVTTAANATLTATGGLVGAQETGATTVASYYDTSTTGQTAADPSNATGETTAQLQSALPAGFDAAWATGAGLYPYLTSFFPNGVQALTTTATGTGVAGGEVSFYAGGGVVSQGTASVGANGYAYQAVAAGTVATGAPVGATLTLPGAATPTAVSFTDAPTTVPGTTGAIAVAPITEGLVSATTMQPTYSALLAELNGTFGPVYRAYASAPPAGESLSITGTATNGFSVDQALGWTATGPLTITTTAGDLGLNAPVSAAGTLDLVSAGAVAEFPSYGVTAATLTGSATTTATLSGANHVATLGGFAAPNGFTLADAVDLTVAGPVTGGPVTLSSTGAIAVDGAVSSTNGGAVLVYADSAASSTGTVTFGTGGSVTTSGPVTILYNPYNATTGYLGTDSSTRAGGNPFSADITGASSVSVRMLVDNATELQALNTQLNGLYQLNADVNLQNVTFTPLGTGAGLGSTVADATGFTGLVDGSRPLGGTAHTVSNLTLDTGAAGAGMFGAIGATGVVQNLNLTNVAITSTASGTGYGYTGGLAGDLYGAVTNVGVTGMVNGVSAVGGLAGLAEGGSSITGATVAAATGGTNYVGGLVGLNYGTVTGATASGSTTGVEYVGGLAGWNETSTNGGGLGTISNASADGTVTASGNYAGGLVGVNDGSITVSATSGSMVSGISYVGGLVGYSGSGSSVISGSVARQTTVVASGNYVGGLVGMNEGEVTGSTASGSVMGAEYVGGLVGWNDASLGGATAGAVSGAASAQVTGSGDYVGGLVGVNTGAITDSQAGSATVSGANLVGGLVGYNAGSIATSSSTAPVSGQVYLGGLVGWNAGMVATSYATGSVTGEAGDQDAANDSFAGGLVGVNFGSLANTYATGAVTGANVVGGLVGDNAAGASADTSYATGAVGGSGALVGGAIGYNAGEVSYVYGFPALSGQSMATGYQDTTASGTGASSLTSDQVGGSAAYAGFDFDATWTANPDAPPTLQQNPPAP